MNKLQFLGLSLMIAASSAATAQDMTLHKKIAVGDDLGWDYLAIDTVHSRLFCSHGTKVLVADMNKDAIIGEISNTYGVHGITFDYTLNKGFISNGKANSVTAFNLDDLSVIDTVTVTGSNPDAILYDDFSRKLFTFNGKSNNATVIDPGSMKIISTIALPGKPEFAVSDQKGVVYVNVEDKNMLVAIDAKNLTVLHTWPIAPGEEPSGLAIDRMNQLLFSVCTNNKLTVFDIKKQRVITTVEIGGHPDAVAYDPSSHRIYSSNGEGNVTVIQQESPSSYKTIQVLLTQKGCKTLAFDGRTKKLYLPAALFEGDTKKVVPGSFDILIYK